MILRPLEDPPSPASGTVPVPLWPLIERSQKTPYSGCWLITQPAHAATSGEMAAALAPESFGTIDESLIRAIAMHDFGWSGPDAREVQASRGAKPGKWTPVHSFLETGAKEVTGIWTASIDAAEKIGPAGGWIVSEHFKRVAQQDPRVADTGFVAAETKRQGRLASKSGLAEAELLRLTDALQFCDLLSLYLCCGLQVPVEFPQQIGGRPIRLTRDTDDIEACQFDPFPFAGPQVFSVVGIRHPKAASNQSMFVLSVVK